MLSALAEGGTTMQLTLDAEDVELLERILSNHLGDLRSEISNTDDYDFRQGLKADEVRLRALLARLRQPGAGGGGAPSETPARQEDQGSGPTQSQTQR
jgi:hypothetical protein